MKSDSSLNSLKDTLVKVFVAVVIMGFAAGSTAIVKTQTNAVKIQNLKDSITDMKSDIKWIRSAMERNYSRRSTNGK